MVFFYTVALIGIESTVMRGIGDTEKQLGGVRTGTIGGARREACGGARRGPFGGTRYRGRRYAARGPFRQIWIPV